MTVKEWLEQLANSNQSNQEDDAEMGRLLPRVGFPKAKCTCGCIYPEGYGQPVSIQSMAKVILNATKAG